MIDKRDRSLILDSLGAMIERAKRIKCRAFISGAGNVVPGLSRGKATENMVETLSLAARVCEKEGITLLLEPFNTKVDHPQYFLDDPEECLGGAEGGEQQSVRMLFDIYHMQIMAGDVTAFIRKNIHGSATSTLQASRAVTSPRESELNYPFILKEIDRLGFKGDVGLEYWPTMEPAESLRQTKAWLEG